MGDVWGPSLNTSCTRGLWENYFIGFPRVLGELCEYGELRLRCWYWYTCVLGIHSLARDDASVSKLYLKISGSFLYS